MDSLLLSKQQKAKLTHMLKLLNQTWAFVHIWFYCTKTLQPVTIARSKQWPWKRNRGLPHSKRKKWDFETRWWLSVIVSTIPSHKQSVLQAESVDTPQTNHTSSCDIIPHKLHPEPSPGNVMSQTLQFNVLHRLSDTKVRFNTNCFNT